jgi:ammonium transporter Rh
MQFSHLANRKRFAFTLIVLEIIIYVMYAVFVRPEVHDDVTLMPIYYPLYQDINVMMLIGFGFLMTFIRRYAWSALSYTFFINAIAVQLYILLSAFWVRIFHGWHDKFIVINEKSFIAASYSVASVLIAFGAILGRVGPL